MSRRDIISPRSKRTYTSLKVILLYAIGGALWSAVAAPLLGKLHLPPLLHTTLTILYFTLSSAIILSILLQSDRVLAESRNAYHQLFQSLLEPVLIHANGVVLNANQLAVQFFDATSKEELVGQPVLSLVHPDYRDTVQKRVQQLNHGESTHVLEEKFITLGGKIRDVEISGIPITFEGKSAILVIFKDITERKQHQMAVQNSARRLRTLIDAMPDHVCFMDAEGRWIEANRTLLRSVGLQDDVYRGKTGRELADLCDPKVRDEFLHNPQYFPLACHTMNHFNREYYQPDGTFTAHEITRVPVENSDGSTLGLVVIERDVSEERRATKKLMESEQRYRSLFDNDGDMVVSVDLHGTIVSANPSCETALGYRPEELIGKCYRDLIAPEYHEGAQVRFRRILHGEPQVLFITTIHKSGRLTEVYEKEIPIIVDGTVTGFFWIIRDMTEQRTAEELMIQSERLSAVGQMAAGVAHEIRNPLTALKGFVQLMQSSKRPPTFYLEVMKDELTRIESIVNELLLFAKPAVPCLKPHDCATLVQEVLDLMSPEAHLRNISMVLRVEDEFMNISCDKNRLKQVLVNIVKNSMEAMPEGGEIDIDVHFGQAQSICICIHDNGPGIPEEGMARIGEPFYTTKGTGTGLGLMVSRKIVEAHRGTLHIESELGKGTEVKIVFPAAELPVTVGDR
ncbi:PAS domain S-box protein [Alicyclobacillus tolerans]|uniref:PAS domain-containing sensor histidine kinase n=1 Tax=Alicyclobacillus tolerans TaxID=90970 RepID=UPI001F306FF8|nr:PAS domain-containing sensor histidine kinase [Alicyclobacillus tolerans]MCF8565005.1 PAS domain S-box protein [Alicyclobacillus tolerans]